MWINRKIKAGSQIGKKIGYPTINFNVGNLANNYKPGVYKCELIIDNSYYIGALYFGPKLNHKGYILEVYIINYNKKIYGQFVRFKVNKKIRDPKKFKNLFDLKKQIEKDLKNVV